MLALSIPRNSLFPLLSFSFTALVIMGVVHFLSEWIFRAVEATYWRVRSRRWESSKAKRKRLINIQTNKQKKALNSSMKNGNTRNEMFYQSDKKSDSIN